MHEILILTDLDTLIHTKRVVARHYFLDEPVDNFNSRYVGLGPTFECCDIFSSF